MRLRANEIASMQVIGDVKGMVIGIHGTTWWTLPAPSAKPPRLVMGETRSVPALLRTQQQRPSARPHPGLGPHRAS
jgi:hypothetical protein